MPDRAHVTLGDVAVAAGVSPATASRVLNGTTKVRDDLRDRVLAAAARLSYSPNANAQALARASSPAIGVVCHDIADPYVTTVAAAVTRAADEADLQVILGTTFRDPEREVAYVSMLRGQRVRAILLIGSGFEDKGWQAAMRHELGLYLASGGRAAAVSRHQGLKIDEVLPENRAGAGALAESLLALGHRDFAVLAGPPELTTVADRVGGFRDALRTAGVEVADDQIVTGTFDRDGGYATAVGLVERGVRATCVFAVADVMAVGALAALRDHGLSVPDDVSLAGFDDVPIVRELTPALSTVALPLEELGRRAMDLVLRPDRSARRRVERVEGKVVLRQSTAPPPPRERNTDVRLCGRLGETDRAATSDTAPQVDDPGAVGDRCRP